MQSKSFFGFAKPAFSYELLSKTLPQPVSVPISESVTLLLPRELGTEPSDIIKVGATVKTGQRLAWDDQPGPAVVSSVTGTIEKVEGYLGEYNRKFTAITVSKDGEDDYDDQFASLSQNVTPQILSDYLSMAPGGGPLDKLINAEKPIDTIVIFGGNTDLLVETSLFVLKSQTAAVNQGIKALKAVTGVQRVIVAVPMDSYQNFDDHFEAEFQPVPLDYPKGQPLMIFHQLTGKMPSQGQSFEDHGVLFISAETAASIGNAMDTGRIPTDNILTVVDKEGTKHLVSARIGTPVGDILKALNITTKEGDRIISGGPMTGTAIYSEQQPISPEADAIMVQDGQGIIFAGDDPCINCGECIRVCPTNVPVNLMIRFLEANQYQEAADLYDLYSCVECGLCSYACTARIPILQYIKLAKYELARAIPAEEEND